jgi:hypothetical protein
MVEAFLLCVGIKIPVPGPKAFESFDGDKVGFVKVALSGLFQNKGFFLKYNVETRVDK